MILYGYWRSTASWRVRIALTLKGLQFDNVPRQLRDGAQHSAAHRALNPQGYVPALALDDGRVLTQSLAIIEYLDETHPTPPLLPATPVERARVRAFAQVIACDIHPIQNLKILKRLKAMGHDQAEIDRWAATIIEEGLDACEELVAHEAGPYCFGEQVTLADLLLVPQLGNARRFGAELRWPRLLAVEEACNALPAFADSRPERQADADG